MENSPGMEALIGKSPKHSSFSIAMFDSRRVITVKPQRLSAPSLGIASRMIDVTPVKEDAEDAVTEGEMDGEFGGRTLLVGGLKHFLFFHTLGIIIPID